jgi:hypothetical protein
VPRKPCSRLPSRRPPDLEHRMRGRLALLTLAAVLAATASARAIVYVAADFQTLVGEARAIVIGRVVALQPQWTDGRRGIETLMSLEVEQSLKGDAGSSVVVRVPGGQIGPYLSMMPGAPQFSEGDEVVLFLAGAPPALPHILALGQGVFRIVSDPVTGARTVVPELLRASGDNVRVVRGDLTRRPTSLARFILDVRRIAAPIRERGVR